ncbi:MAG: 16S rRNA (guanine(527)-N(7))-methyltransferase RsmG [Rudaea sp.]
MSSPTDRATLLARLIAGSNELGLPLDSSRSEALIDYIALLARWNDTYNLTAVRDTADMVTRHLLDSLAIAPHVRGQTLIDLGTGAGLPGIPLAVLEPQRTVTLVDSNGKKTRFLREAVRVMGLSNVRVEQARAEDLRGSFDCVVARAFASIADFLRLGGHLLAPDGLCLAMKGQLSEDEILGMPAGYAVREIVPLKVPGLGAARHLVIINRCDDEATQAATSGEQARRVRGDEFSPTSGP